MDANTLLVWGSGIAGALLVLVIRHVVKPVPSPVRWPPPHRDWSPLSFGLDLVIASFLAAPAAFSLRVNIDERLNLVKRLQPPPSIREQLDNFFAEPLSSAALWLTGGIIAGIVGMGAAMFVLKAFGYIPEVPHGCSHPPLRMRGMVLEVVIGCAVALALAIVTDRLTR